MNTEFKNRVDLERLLFWKSFLRVFALFYLIELTYIFAFEYRDSFEVFVSKFFMVATSFNLFLYAFISSFISAYFIRKRLINENPEKVFTVGLAKLSLVFFVAHLFMGTAMLFLAGAPSFLFGLLFFLVIPMLVFFVWLYLSTLWLYRYFKKHGLIWHS